MNFDVARVWKIVETNENALLLEASVPVDWNNLYSMDLILVSYTLFAIG